MTIPVSTAPTVKTWLFNQLTANLTPASGERLLVSWNEPGLDLPGDIVSVGDILNRVTTVAGMVGNGQTGFLDEQYSLEVVIDVYRGGDNAKLADLRAWTLSGAVEQIIRGDLTAGGVAGIFDFRPAAAQSTGRWTEDHHGHAVRLTLAVDVAARI